MQNPFRHVRSGEPLTIPATAYNAMLDAAQANRNRRMNLAQHGVGFDSLFVHIVNETGRRLKKFDIVGLDGPLNANDPDTFFERIVMRGVVPQKNHRGKFAVIQEDAAPDMVVRACVYGMSIARVQVNGGIGELKFCDAKENETGFLVSGGHTEVLWSDEGERDRWAIIRIGSGKSTLFPVNLEHTGGEQGDHENAASWTYTVTDAMTDETLEEAVDPTEMPHQWRRPELGAMSKATFGYAHYDSDDNLVLGWINEVMEVAICGETENDDY